MKRIIAFFLCLLISVSFINISAETDKKQKITSAISESDSLHGFSYGEYLAENKDFSFETKEISLNANNISAKEGSGVKEENGGVSLTNRNDSITFKFNVSENGWYEPYIKYTALEGNGNDITMSLKIDGSTPYAQMENFTLYRLWKDAENLVTADEFGNEYAPEQVEVCESQVSGILDSEGFITGFLKLALKKGEHTLTLTCLSEQIKIEEVTLSAPSGIKTYKEYKNELEAEGKALYKGETQVIQGEDAAYKSQKSFVSLTNRNVADITPNDPFAKKVNYIGGSNWNSLGGAISWKVNAPKSGFYKIGFHFHQTYIQEGNSYRALLIDGKVPFKEAENVPFSYKSGWQYSEFEDKNGEPMLVYLSEGEHILSLRVTLGELSDFASRLKNVTSELGIIYREIVKITGENPDNNRDYELFSALPHLEKDFTEIVKELEDMADESEKLAGAKGGSNASTLRKAVVTIKQMLEKKYESHTKLTVFYDNYSSLSSWLFEMQNMGLDIDEIYIASSNADIEEGKKGFLSKTAFSVKRLFATFIKDYTKKSTKKEKTITIWSSWGRDQLNVLDSLIVNDFIPNNGIDVDLKITTASLIEAGLSGNGPDLMLGAERTAPLNYAMRGILYDLSKFSDFENIKSLFSETAFTPYIYKDGVYGLPCTETFGMLFIRTDIFEDMGLTVPKTWPQFIKTAKILAFNNMESGMGGDLPLFMTQMGVPYYKEDHSATNLKSAEAVEATTYWLDFFTKYGLPISYSFFNRFRIGLMPMGIAPFTEYATLKAAAPEISGKWQMYELPGVVNADGSVNNTATASGTASLILDWSKDKESAWQFLKWWSGEDIQYRFGVNCESVLGVSGRWPSATLNATYRYGWEGDSLTALKNQFSKLYNIPEVPGSYYVSRSVQQVYWNVINQGESVEDMLNKWIPEADDEIRRKTEEYSLYS